MYRSDARSRHARIATAKRLRAGPPSLIVFSLDLTSPRMEFRRISPLIRGVGIALLLLGVILFAHDLFSSFHSEERAAPNGTISITQGFHTSLRALGTGIGGIGLIVLSIWWPKRS